MPAECFWLSYADPGVKRWQVQGSECLALGHTPEMVLWPGPQQNQAMWRKTYSVALVFTAPLCPAWTAHRQRKQKPSGLSRGKKERRKERETERRGGGEPGYLQPLLLGFSIIHTPGQLNALGPQLYTWYKTRFAHSNAHAHTLERFWNGGVKCGRMLTAHIENCLFCMPTRT